MDNLTRLIVNEISRNGGTPMLVGGCVRDHYMGVEPKDIDVEVYGMTPDDLQKTIGMFGQVDLVGASFGVMMLHGHDAQFSLPRRESKSGKGHKGFMVEVDPNMTIEEAAARRDFTMNAMAMDPFTLEIIDPYGGRRDIDGKVLRHTSLAFAEDPLRVLRGFQFAGRFGMYMTPDTVELCANLVLEYPSLAKERVWGEWWKWATKSTAPDYGLLVLLSTDWLTLYPELYILRLVIQDPEHHPEGQLWNHTRLAVIRATEIACRENLSDRDRAVLVFAALCHDFGKPETTDITDRITTHGHDMAGEAPARAFMSSIGAPADITEEVVSLVKCHMRTIVRPINRRVVNHIARDVQPSTIQMLAWVIEADHSARPPLPGGMPDGAKEMLRIASDIGNTNSAPKDILMGRHLIELGMEPGPAMGKLLAEAREAQTNDVFQDLTGALEWVKGRIE